jgi:hypothetical protein
MIHIVPNTGQPGGVANYAFLLAENLRRSNTPGRMLLIGDFENHPPTSLKVSSCSTNAVDLQDCLQTPRDETVILHYVNYGYEKRGCPFYLVEALNQWKLEPGRKLITIFHEVNASGPPWRSSFWLAPVQRRIAREILDLSEAAVTSMHLYKDALVQFNPTRKNSIYVLPVFSTVGEPETLPDWKERLPQMILFGSKGVRSRVWKNSKDALIRACERLNIQEIIDIGSPIMKDTVLGKLSVRSLGELESKEVSGILANACAGFLDYPTGFLTKSTIFAAYCAHGLLPVTARKFTGTEGGIRENLHYWNISGSPNVPDGVAANALEWYRSHTLQNHVELFSNLLSSENALFEQL